MRRSAFAGIFGSVFGVVLAGQAGAAEIALVIGNDPEEDAAVGLLADALNARGYEVYQRSGASRAEIAAALDEVAGRLDEADRLILFHAGPVLAYGEEGWLVPEGAGRESWLELAFEGVPVETLLALAGARPGRAAVVIGTGETEASGALVPGIGAPEVPQGVLLVAGATGAAVEALTEHLLIEEVRVADAVPALGTLGVTAAGFAGPDLTLAPALDAAAEAEAEDAPDEDAAAPGAQQVDAGEAAEQALGLDQAARRQVQGDLTVLGFPTRGIDGIFGPGTRTAIGDWQEARGYARTGFLDAAQRGALRSEGEARSAELAAEAEAAQRAEEEADAAFWRTTGANGGAADMRAYLDRYPEGVYAGEARAALDRMDAVAREEAAGEDRAAWERAVEADDEDGYRRYLADWPEGAFAGEAEARVANLAEAPERERRDAEAAAREEAIGLNAGSRALIETQLGAVGFDAGEPDGTFDRQTRRAIRQFQTRQGLEVTGYIDQGTVQALIVASLGLR